MIGKLDSHNWFSLPMEGTMVQLHKRFSDEHVIFLLRAYERGLISREKVRDAPDIHRSRLFTLWREYCPTTKSNPLLW